MRRFSLLFVFLFNYVFLICKDEVSASLQKLETIVITGTKTNKTFLNSPVRVEVIQSQDIEKHHAKNLNDALQYIPGLYFSQTHGKQGYEVSMQGFDANRILILIDGERVSASTGSTVDLNHILTADIDRIEIVKGASSCLHGSEAMGGVINVISKNSKKGIRGSIGIDTGTYDTDSERSNFDTIRVFENFSFKNDNWKFKFNADYQDDDGFDYDERDVDTNGDEIRIYNIASRITYFTKSSLNIYFGFNFLKEEKQRLSSSFAPGIGDIVNVYEEKIKRLKLNSGVSYIFDNASKITFKSNYENFQDEAIQDVKPSVEIEQTRSADVDSVSSELQYDFSLFENHVFTSGIVANFEEMDQLQEKEGVSSNSKVEEIPDGSDKFNFSMYFQDDYQVSEQFEIVPGIRYQYDEDFGSFLAPKFNIAYSAIEDLSLRFSFGLGYRVPNLKERYYFFDHSNLGYQVIGNANLEPEKSQNYQLGLIYSHRKKIIFELNGFYNHISNLIDTAIDIDQSKLSGLQVYTYQNISKAQTYGLDSSIRFQLMNDFETTFGYSLLFARDLETKKTLTQRSRHQIKTSLSYKVKKIKGQLLLDWIYQDKQYIDSLNALESPQWNTLDIKWNQNIYKSFSAHFGVKNIFNVHRAPNPENGADYRPVSGRYYFIGFTYKFSKEKS